MGAVLSVALVVGLLGCREPSRQSEPPAVARGSERPVADVPEVVDARPAGVASQQETCAVKDVELVYLVDWDNNFYSFDPRKLPSDPFTKIGPLTCEQGEKPYSMAVDHHGIAWVAYANGKLYRVRIIDARCSAGVAPDGAPDVHGMGFASDDPKSEDETLYVADRLHQELGALDIRARPPRYTRVDRIDFQHITNPELTGTADGKLYAYFPHERFISEIDRKTAKLVGPRRKLPGKAGKDGEVGGYAFAHWGGVFYVFATLDGNSAVHAINWKTGKYQLVSENLPMQIVGAGVSTCAPLLERAP